MESSIHWAETFSTGSFGETTRDAVSASADDLGGRGRDFEEGVAVRAVGAGADLRGGDREALAAMGTGPLAFNLTPKSPAAPFHSHP